VFISEASGAYHQVEGRLSGSDDLVKLALLGVIAVALFLIVQPSRTARLAGALWFVLP
jgi:hypothetical protein